MIQDHQWAHFMSSIMNNYLVEQLQNHPAVEPQDIVKLCYQAVFGAEHMLKDAAAARQYLYEEFEAAQPADIPICENISDQYCRVNIAGWKYHGLSKEELFELFWRTAAVEEGHKAAEHAHAERFRKLMEEYLETVRQACGAERFQALKAYLETYYREGIHPVHHSDEYREAENPHYRVVRRDLLPVDVVKRYGM
ncbi:MAG: hypothetical protein GX228_03670 [Firmicutes bacterium]|nr:hypothetical protein [Bacillota bacterium]